MVEYLCKHRISVFVTTGILVILGILAYHKIPTSLLPEISIPEIVVQVHEDELTAEEMEHQIISTLRHHLNGTNRLRDMHCISQDGFGEIRLKMEYGTHMDLAYVETNERIDAAMTYLPKGIKRPNVSRINSSDIPVFTLMVTNKHDTEDQESSHLELSEIVHHIFKSKLEQLPEVSVIDISGAIKKELQITPDSALAEKMGVTIYDIEDAFKNQNINAGTLTISDKGKWYGVKLNSSIQNKEDALKIPILIGNRHITLGQIARIKYNAAPIAGEVIYDGKRAVAIAVIKQQNVKMEHFQNATSKVIAQLKKDFPQYAFHKCNDQANILEKTLKSLRNNLGLGLGLVLLVSFFFFRDLRIPFIVSTSTIIAFIISIGVLFLCKISLNIVSLVGLILAVGMMIDNALIATDEITWFHQQGYTSFLSCKKGINQILTPMLSSMLTTIIVFLPLLFSDGISGILFRDQAWSVSICLIISFCTSIFFLPVLYHAITYKKKVKDFGHNLFLGAYSKGIVCVLNHKKTCIAIILMSIPSCVLLFREIKKESLPQTKKDELVGHIIWPQGTNLEENIANTKKLLKNAGTIANGSYAYIGEQQFFLQNEKEYTHGCVQWVINKNNNENIYTKAKNADSIMHDTFSGTYIDWSPPKSIMEKMFPTDKKDISIQIYKKNDFNKIDKVILKCIQDSIAAAIKSPVILPKEKDILVIHLKQEIMNFYGVTPNAIKNSFEDITPRKHIATLQNTNDYIPVYVNMERRNNFHQWIQTSRIKGKGENEYPLKKFASIHKSSIQNQFYSDKKGDYIPLTITNPPSLEKVEKTIKKIARQFPEFSFLIKGASIENVKIFKKLGAIFLISVILIYLILTAQFESFLQPLIILIEIPIDMATGLFALWCTGMSLNVMSAIGLIVACGIVVNDSILKLNAINLLRSNGIETQQAIHEAGKRRLRSIIMTSLTSIFALFPVLWGTDIGSEFQKPFAVALIASLTIGTIVSVYIIPLIFTIFYNKK